MELTSGEKKVLSGISFNADRIAVGELDENETEILKEMRSVGDYLKEKYPSYNLEITGCEPKSGTVRDYDEWYFESPSSDDNALTGIALFYDKDTSFEIRDNFYGEIIKASMAEQIEKALAPSASIIDIKISFFEYLGKEYGEDISSRDVLCGKIKAGNNIKLFVDASGIDPDDLDSKVSEIKKLLSKASVVGDIYVIFLMSSDADPLRDRVYSDDFTLGGF